MTGYGQAGEWTWVKGADTLNSPGSYGMMGIANSLNEPPGRYAPGFWTDTAGNFWVYGGLGATGVVAVLEDLWQFNPATHEWTWMNGDSTGATLVTIAAAKGQYSPQNTPGGLALGFFTWVTPDNHLWLFGGGLETGFVNSSLWQYNPVINQWAWMGTFDTLNNGAQGVPAATNQPYGRCESNSAWVDTAGNLWLWGGQLIDTSYNVYDRNDIWKYDVSTGIWTWIGGSANNNDGGAYGPTDTPSVNHYPAGYSTNLFWSDQAGNFWLGGGIQWSSYNLFHDIWKFNPYTLQWTWVNGPGLPAFSSAPVGVACQQDSANTEGTRYENRAVWKLCDDLIINYGGYESVLDASPSDLWAYSPSKNRWLKIASGDSAGHYGTQGVGSQLNYPPARLGCPAFKDKQNNLWLFAGDNGAPFTGFSGYYNDLWKYVLDSACVGSLMCCNLSAPVLSANPAAICPGDSSQICISSPANFAGYNWNTSQTTACIEATTGGDYEVTVTDAYHCTAGSNPITITALQAPVVNISRAGDTLLAYNAAGVQWFLNDSPIAGATKNIYIAHLTGSYSVSVTDTDGCTSYSSPFNYTGVTDITMNDNIKVYPNPLQVGSWKLEVGSEYIGAMVEMLDDNGRVVYKFQIEKTHSEINAQFAGGVYLLRITTGGGVVMRKLVKL